MSDQEPETVADQRREVRVERFRVWLAEVRAILDAANKPKDLR